MMGLERLGAFVAAHHPVPDRLGLHVLDTVGALLAGVKTAEAAQLRRLRKGRIALLGEGVVDRVALRVACTRLSEVDDIHLASCVTPAMCGDEMTVSSVSSGLSAGVGSCSNTSRPAPAMWPDFSA